MSAELIGVIVTGVGLALTMIVTALGGLRWVVRRSDEQYEALRGEVHGLRGEMQQGFAGLRGEMNQSLDGSRSEMQQSVDGLRAEMHQGFDGLRAEISQLRTEMGEEKRAIRSDVGELRKEVNEIHVSLARLEGPQVKQPAG